MKTRRGIFVCGTLQREVAAALLAEGLSDVEIVGFPCECGGQVSGETAFERAWRARADAFSQLLVLGEPCVHAAQLQTIAAGHANVRFMPSGFELFLPKGLVQDYQCDGAYLLTPGWLASWPERIERWGFERTTAEAFFAESCARLVLLDTGIDACSSTQLAAFASFVNRPSATVPVGLEMLRLRLARHWGDWPQSPSMPAGAPPAMQSTADYAMIFDLMSRLVGVTSEVDLAQGFFDLFEMICAPAGLAYLPFRGGKVGEMIISPDATITSTDWAEALAGLRSDCTWLAERDGFVLRIQQEGEVLGALLVDRVALPLRKADYLNLTATILPVLALAVANVRHMERQAHSKAVLQRSEARYRTLFESSRDAIVTIEPPSWRFTSGNPAAVKMFRAQDEAQLILHAPRELSPDKQPDGRASSEIVPERIQTALREGSARFEWTHRRIDGEEFPATVLLSRLGSGEEAFLQATVRDITERKRLEKELLQAHRQLVDASRQAGMAEVATSVLHNVGNVLNSVNIAASVVADSLKQPTSANLAKAAALMRDHKADLGPFLALDPQGRQLPAYLTQLAEHLHAEQAGNLKELHELTQNIGHIKDIVAMQQGYARASGVIESVRVSDLVEDALRLNAESLTRHDVQLVREVDPELPAFTVDRHNVLQILVNLIRNAKDACDASDCADKRITVRVTHGEDRVRIAISDNGVGIPPENLTRIFTHGFTTRKDGHGFGLHNSALAATEMGGSLSVQSGGPGQGAAFTLDLPQQPLEDIHD